MDIIELMKQRKSVRHFKPDQPEKQVILDCLEAAAWAPNPTSQQPWKFIVLTGETLIGDEPFGVILADDLCVGRDLGVIAQMVRIYEKYRCSILAIEEVDPQEVHKYGVIAGSQLDENTYMVSSMVVEHRLASFR